MESPPLSSIHVLRKEQFRLSPKGPCLQTRLSIIEARLRQLPCNLAATVATDPLAIDIYIDVDVKAPFHKYIDVRSRQRLSQS